MCVSDARALTLHLLTVIRLDRLPCVAAAVLRACVATCLVYWRSRRGGHPRLLTLYVEGEGGAGYDGTIVVQDAHRAQGADDVGCRVMQDLSRRIGNLKGGGAEIRAHPWFKGFDWEALVNRQMTSPIGIHAKSADDSSFFDEYSEHDGPDINAGGVRPEQQPLFKTFSKA